MPDALPNFQARPVPTASLCRCERKDCRFAVGYKVHLGDERTCGRPATMILFKGKWDIMGKTFCTDCGPKAIKSGEYLPAEIVAAKA